LAEVQRWVLGWGGDAKVIQPKELVENIKLVAKKILEG
jgi:predicted DNA-binding transcriptional regulator YafY